MSPHPRPLSRHVHAPSPGEGSKARGRVGASVFINCPLDERYAALLDALVFAIVCCGFVPRSAMESGTVSEPRIDRIVRTLFASRYSIHDLSRSRGEGEENWSRFNMPLELGMAVARRYATRNRRDAHDWLLLVSQGRHYRRFVSDLAGFDPETHEETVDTLLPKVIAWLANRTAVRTPTPAAILAKLPAFQEHRARLTAAWKGAVPWKHLVVAAEEVAKEV